MFRNLSVARKWSVSILAVALLLSGVILYSLLGLLSASRDINELVGGPYQQEKYVSQSRITILQLARDIRDLYIQTLSTELTPAERQSKAKEYAIKIEGDKTQLYQQLGQLEKAFAEPPAIVGEYRRAVDAWIGIGDRIVRAVTSGDKSAAAVLILNDCPEALDALTEVAKRIDWSAAVAAEEASTHSLRSVWVTCGIAATAFAAAMLLTFLLSRKVRKSILPPLSEVQQLAEELSRGNLNYPVSYHSQDEFGRLADSLRESEQILSSYIADISKAMKELSLGNFDISPSQKFAGDFAEIETSITRFILTMSELLRQVSSFSEQVSAGTEQVAAGAQNLAQGTVEQAGSIEEIAANLSSTAEKVSANARDAAHASEAAEEAGRKISECRVKMDGMTRAMAEIETAAAKIGGIIHTIEDIAFQTNLLSLNAAVEAAHAGAAGRGFAVVAGEVRELAVKSAEASQSTAALIEQAAASVKNGAKIAHDTAETLFATVDHVSDTADMLSGISEACAQQAELLSQVNLGVQQVSIVVQNNSATAEESAAASEELASLARSLRALVGRFHPKDS